MFVRDLLRIAPAVLLCYCAGMMVTLYFGDFPTAGLVQAIFAAMALAALVAGNLMEVVPWLRRLTGRDTGTRADAVQHQAVQASGYVALLATQLAGIGLFGFLQVTGQDAASIQVVLLLAFSKIVHWFLLHYHH